MFAVRPVPSIGQERAGGLSSLSQLNCPCSADGKLLTLKGPLPSHFVSGSIGTAWYQFRTGFARPTGDETCGRLVRSVGGEVGFVMVRASPRISWTWDA
jgi:hypothetical protein